MLRVVGDQLPHARDRLLNRLRGRGVGIPKHIDRRI
jgi:hypothetical protein